MGRGVAGSGGVKTALGAAEGALTLNGVGDVTTACRGTLTLSRRAPAS